MIEAENVTLHYGGSQVLHGVSLTAEPGQVTCVMGNNGVGKTSLLKTVRGVGYKFVAEEGHAGEPT